MIEQLEQKARQIRLDILKMCGKAQTGHVTSAFSCVEILVALYYGKILNFDRTNPASEKRDRFILSKGQASVILYPILADLGFFPIEQLDSFCAVDGAFGVHLQHDVPGAEITSGSLGVGFGIAAGMALAAQKNRAQHIVVSLLGDGECYEGAIWETAMFAAHHKLNNFLAIVDRNSLCATDFTERILELEDFTEKWKAFGWQVTRVNGHSLSQLLETMNGFRSRKDSRPMVIIADTVKGQGVDFICNQPLRHGTALIGEELKRANQQLGKKGN